MQILFLTETRARANTDYQYVRRYMQLSYPRMNRGFHIGHIPMTSKSEYCKCERRILQHTKEYAFTHKGADSKTFVVLCIDTDAGGPSEKDNGQITHYCREQGYHLVWFHRDVEEVFLGRRVIDKEKKNLADRFSIRGALPAKDNLSVMEFSPTHFGTTNIRLVLDPIMEEISNSNHSS